LFYVLFKVQHFQEGVMHGRIISVMTCSLRYKKSNASS
jgi:hypothetical protein